MKKKLRSIKLLERLEHNPQEKAEKDRLIMQKISRLAGFRRSQKILFYLPIHGEVDLVRIFEKFHTQKTFILPRVNGKKLDLHIIKDLRETEKGKFKILEPRKHLLKTKIQGIDIALIPGVVFSKNGHRIGYGQGHFDRLLKNTNCVKIGIAYDFQIVDNIAGEQHDVPMNMIVTEKRVIKPAMSS